jgi:magnesium-transporting ATPase (P-type)
MYIEDRRRDVISAGTIVVLIIALVFLGTWLFKALAMPARGIYNGTQLVGNSISQYVNTSDPWSNLFNTMANNVGSPMQQLSQWLGNKTVVAVLLSIAIIIIAIEVYTRNQPQYY